MVETFIFILTITIPVAVALSAMFLAVSYPVIKYHDHQQAIIEKHDSATWTAYSQTDEYKHNQVLYAKWLGREK